MITYLCILKMIKGHHLLWNDFAVPLSSLGFLTISASSQRTKERWWSSQTFLFFSLCSFYLNKKLTQDSWSPDSFRLSSDVDPCSIFSAHLSQIGCCYNNWIAYFSILFGVRFIQLVPERGLNFISSYLFPCQCITPLFPILQIFVLFYAANPCIPF